MGWLAQILLFVVGVAPCFADVESSNLPEDSPTSVEVVHQLLYPLTNHFVIDLNAGSFYGDKYVDSYGVRLGGTFYFSETWGLGAAFSAFKNSLTDETGEMFAPGSVWLIHNPEYELRGYVSYVPIYGKFAIGQTIQRFRLGVELGIHAAQEKTYLSDVLEKRMLFGPNIGMFAEFPFSSWFSGILRIDFAAHKKFESAERGGLRKFWFAMAGVGVRL